MAFSIQVMLPILSHVTYAASRTDCVAFMMTARGSMVMKLGTATQCMTIWLRWPCVAGFTTNHTAICTVVYNRHNTSQPVVVIYFRFEAYSRFSFSIASGHNQACAQTRTHTLCTNKCYQISRSINYLKEHTVLYLDDTSLQFWEAGIFWLFCIAADVVVDRRSSAHQPLESNTWF